MKIDWDLSERHTLDETSWPKGRLDSYTTSLEPLESVRIRVPGDVTLQMSDRAKRVILYRRSQGPDPCRGRRAGYSTRSRFTPSPCRLKRPIERR